MVYSPSKPIPSFSAGLHQGEHNPCLEQEVVQLLQQWQSQKWPSLSADYVDPLEMLFGNRATQWTAAWQESGKNFYLLIWSTESWQETPSWFVYRNGSLLFQQAEGVSKRIDRLCQGLLDHPQLPVLNEASFITSLFIKPLDIAGALQTARTVWQTMKIFQPLWHRFKAPMLEVLEANLNQTAIPALPDLQKLQQLDSNLPLLWLIQQACFSRLLQEPTDLARLLRLLSQMGHAYKTLALSISAVMLPALSLSQDRFRLLLATERWFIRLHQAEQWKRPLSTVLPTAPRA